MQEAWRWKHRLGGAMRQSGIIAAAGVYALDHNMELLAEDHRNAQRLGEYVTAIPGLKLYTPKIESNIVFFDTTDAGVTTKAVYEEMLKRNVRMGLTYGAMIRAVTHHDVSRADIDAAGKVLAEAVAAAKKTG